MLRTRLLVLLAGSVFLLIAAPALMLKSLATNLTNSPPVAVDDSYTVHVSLLISPMQNDSDPDPGDSISFQGITTQPQHGTLQIYNTGTYTYRPTYGYVGSDSFTYTICDSHSACSTGTVNMTAVNQAPVANTDNYTVHTTKLFSPHGNDTDPDGDSVSFQSISQPQHGTLTPYSTGTYTYRPVYGYVGLDSFTYTIKDSLGAVATGTINMTAVNQAPIANSDNYTVHTSILFSPHGNDTDPDGDSVSFQSISQPQHGTLSPYSTGAYTYRPAYGYVGFDSFTYTINDSLGAVATGTINITAVNQSPLAMFDYYNWKFASLLGPMSNDTDPDGDSLTFQGIVSQPLHGSLNPYSPGIYTYSPWGGYTGFDSFTYSIRDSLGAVSTRHGSHPCFTRRKPDTKGSAFLLSH
jgi:hypothetical protein